MSKTEPTLKVFSAGAVAPPLQKASALFEKSRHVRIDMKIGKPGDLLLEIEKSKQGDVISTGAEYVLDDAQLRGTIVPASRRSLGYRRSVLVVPIGNPARISSLEDLCRDGVRIGIATEGCLKGIWDDIASKAGLTDRIRKNITNHADSCGGVMALVNLRKVDAIFGWNAFKNLWPETSDIVELPRDLQVMRSTVAAAISYTKDAHLTDEYLSFLGSEKVRRIYSDLGWITR